MKLSHQLARAAAVIAALCSCSGTPDDPTLASVFAIMCADIDPSMPPHPCCSGFALGSEVVTASHCVPDDTASLVTRKQWKGTASDSEIGTVRRRDEGLDIAWLSAELDGPGLTQGATVMPGDAVRVLTERGALPGIVGDTVGAFWQSTADTRLGDSGSAVVDVHGRAVGVLSRCLTDNGMQCDPHTGIFAGLP